jgi:MFS family permease
MTLASVGAAWVAQRAITRTGTRAVAASRLALLAPTCLIFAATASAKAGLLALAIGMPTFGIGMGYTFVAGSVASLDGVPERESGVAAAVQNISFTLGVAVLPTAYALGGSYLAALLGPGAAGGAPNAGRRPPRPPRKSGDRTSRSAGPRRASRGYLTLSAGR